MNNVTELQNAQTAHPAFHGCYGSPSGASSRSHHHLNTNTLLSLKTLVSDISLDAVAVDFCSSTEN